VDANGRFEFERRHGGAVWLLTVRDHLGGGHQPLFDGALAIVSGADAVVVDVSFSHLDSAELATLLRHARTVQGWPDRVTVVAQPGSPGRQVLDVCGAKRFVRVFDTTDEGVDAASKHGRPNRNAAGLVQTA
jgi:hypothetical protein